MATYLITYDLNNETTRPPILEKIKEFSWAMLSESSYAINTTMTATEVYDFLKPLLDGDDTLYIITLGRPYTGFGPPEVNDWLEALLPPL
ncbi:hypothetical protein [Comamonas sp. MYb396]|uniref:hypothetical protein n=1 Tax=Comamonas sp. MYb396 TaxID=2745302 RepID=UPI0030AE6109